MQFFVTLVKRTSWLNLALSALFLLFLCSPSKSEDQVLLLEQKVQIGEPLGGKWKARIKTDSVSAYRDSCLKYEVGTLYFTDDIEVLDSVLLLHDFGHIKVTKPPTQYPEFYLLDENQELVSALEYYHQKFDRSDAKVMKLAEKLYSETLDSLKVGNEACVYRYLWEGYYLIRLGEHFVTLNQNCFDFLQKPTYLWAKRIRSGNIKGWIDATKLNNYAIVDEN